MKKINEKLRCPMCGNFGKRISDEYYCHGCDVMFNEFYVFSSVDENRWN
ncbi:MAG: hypothetical protein V1900_03045 [Candidatus Aenigmatarchaeota archaeon]